MLLDAHCETLSHPAKQQNCSILSVTTLNFLSHTAKSALLVPLLFNLGQLSLRSSAIIQLTVTRKGIEQNAAYPSQEFRLKPGERITACTPLLSSGSNRIFEALANCHQCLSPTHRVIVITARSGLQHRAYLCAHHFAEAAKTFPELQRQSA
jgi:hypothetical protein